LAWWAPGGPEIKEDYLSLVVGESHFFLSLDLGDVFDSGDSAANVVAATDFNLGVRDSRDSFLNLSF